MAKLSNATDLKYFDVHKLLLLVFITQKIVAIHFLQSGSALD